MHVNSLINRQHWRLSHTHSTAKCPLLADYLVQSFASGDLVNTERRDESVYYCSFISLLNGSRFEIAAQYRVRPSRGSIDFMVLFNVGLYKRPILFIEVKRPLIDLPPGAGKRKAEGGLSYMKRTGRLSSPTLKSTTKAIAPCGGPAQYWSTISNASSRRWLRRLTNDFSLCSRGLRRRKIGRRNGAKERKERAFYCACVCGGNILHWCWSRMMNEMRAINTRRYRRERRSQQT